MKLQVVSFLALALCLSVGCGKNADDSLPPLEIELSDFEKHDETEYEGEVVVEVAKKLYCEWTVSSTDGENCKFKAGDVICYRCNEDGCPPGIISVGRNFGDGCRTFGSFTDTGCEEKEDGDCAGKYR